MAKFITAIFLAFPRVKSPVLMMGVRVAVVFELIGYIEKSELKQSRLIVSVSAKSVQRPVCNYSYSFEC